MVRPMDSPVAVPQSNRAVALLVGWAPFVLVLMAYELMRDVASTLGVRPHNLSGVERALFGGYEPTLVLQSTIGKLADADLIDDAGSMVYSAHFLLPIIVGIWLWRRNRADFHRFGLSLVVLCALAFLTYVVAPTAPPWLAQPQSVQHLMQDAVLRSGLPPALTWLYSHHDYNLYAAFPSLHAGFPVLAAAAAWRRNRVVGVVLSIWALVVWVTVVYLGEHYVADVVGGIIYAVIALGIVSLLVERRSRALRVEEP
ncbi:MAG TPA: phosphatase PAP2 family protein [Candidatus Dormibacteraeota bacterium]|jgi:membrane-associated phospholipid phosphatase|nr:phosphatase PAP2 family protein [Candidatus Dormibacteraeota bacterium]